MSPWTRLTVATVATAALVGTLAPRARAAPATTNNWNQWDDDGRDGVVQGTTDLALGVDYTRVAGARALGDHTVRLGAEVEHLLRDRWGLVGSVALPLDGEWVAPATLGMRLHFVPKFPVDPFVGVAGGVAWLRPADLPAIAAPIVSARGGLAFHYFGLFFVLVEGGYDFVRYARDAVTLDRGGASFTARLGLGF